jgi:hypothetical protein
MSDLLCAIVCVINDPVIGRFITYNGLIDFGQGMITADPLKSGLSSQRGKKIRKGPNFLWKI